MSHKYGYKYAINGQVFRGHVYAYCESEARCLIHYRHQFGYILDVYLDVDFEDWDGPNQ